MSVGWRLYPGRRLIWTSFWRISGCLNELKFTLKNKSKKSSISNTPTPSSTEKIIYERTKSKCCHWNSRFLLISLKGEWLLELSAIILGFCGHKGEPESELQNLHLITRLSLTPESCAAFVPVCLTDSNTSSYFYNLKDLFFCSVQTDSRKGSPPPPQINCDPIQANPGKGKCRQNLPGSFKRKRTQKSFV